MGQITVTPTTFAPMGLSNPLTWMVQLVALSGGPAPMPQWLDADGYTVFASVPDGVYRIEAVSGATTLQVSNLVTVTTAPPPPPPGAGEPSIADYGAVASPGVDNTAAIQAAFNDGVYLVPPGAFDFTHLALDRDNPALRGYGPFLSQLVCTDPAGGIEIGNGATYRYSPMVANLGLYQNTPGASAPLLHGRKLSSLFMSNVRMIGDAGGSYVGLRLDDCYAAHMALVDILGFDQYTAMLYGGSDYTLAGMRLDHQNHAGTPAASYALFVYGVRGAAFNGVLCEDGGAACVNVEASSELKFSGSTMNGALYHGLYLASSCHHIGVANCDVMYNGARGVVIEGKAATIAGSRIVANGTSGISLSGTDTDAMIAGNLIARNNHTNTNSEHGIAVMNNTTGFQIQGNRISNSGTAPEGRNTPGYQRYGINIGGGANDYIVTNNRLSGNVSGGLYDGGGTNKIATPNLGA